MEEKEAKPDGKRRGKPKYELDDLLKVRERSKDTAEVVRKISVSEVGGESIDLCYVSHTRVTLYWTVWPGSRSSETQRLELIGSLDAICLTPALVKSSPIRRHQAQASHYSRARSPS